MDLVKYEETSLLDIENDILIRPEDMYIKKREAVEVESSLSLEDAFIETLPAEFAGVGQGDALPTVPKRAMDTGLLPPADESHITYTRIQNKQALGLEKYKKLLLMGKYSLADTKGYRIRTAYRLIRQMSRVRGLLEGWSWLDASFAMHAQGGMSVWSVPKKLEPSNYLTGYRGVRNVLRHIDNAKEIYTFNTPQGYRGFKGSTTLPPPLPDSAYPSKRPQEIWQMRAEGYVPEDYEPRNDKNLCLYCEAMALMAHQLCIEHGSPEEPWAGIYGMAGLLNPGAARFTWPTRDELVMYEEELLLHVFSIVTKQTADAAHDYMMHFFGFNRFEAVDIVKTAIEAGGVLFNEQAENQRASILKQLENVQKLCLDACDPRAALASIKMRSQILGLTASEENETMSTLRDAAVNALRRPDDDDLE